MSELEDLDKKIGLFKASNAPKKHKAQNKLYVKVFNIAIDLGAVILVGLFIGRWLDGYFVCSPMFLLISLIISVIAALKMIIQSK